MFLLSSLWKNSTVKKAILLGSVVGLVASSCTASESTEASDQVPSLRAYEPHNAQNNSEGQSEDLDSSYADNMIPPNILETQNVGAASIDFTTYYQNLTEYYDHLSKCMESQGWPALNIEGKYTSSQGVSFTGAETDPKRYADDFDSCQENGSPQPMPPEFTPKIAEQQYEKALKAHACLVDNGARIADLPSKQQFMDNFLVKKMPWDPRQNDEKGTFNPQTDPLFSKTPIEEIYQRCPW